MNERYNLGTSNVPSSALVIKNDLTMISVCDLRIIYTKLTFPPETALKPVR